MPRAGVGWPSGTRPGYGGNCTNRYSPNCVPPRSWNCRSLWSTGRICGHSKGDHVGPSSVDRAKPGSKHHVITDATGIPLAVTLAGGNRHDVTQLIPLLDALPIIGGRRGRPWRRPRYLYADRGYDYDRYRRQLRARGITPVIARRGTAHGSGLGIVRWPVDRAFAWLHAFKRLRTRYERRADIHHALLTLACAVICLRKLILN